MSFLITCYHLLYLYFFL